MAARYVTIRLDGDFYGRSETAVAIARCIWQAVQIQCEALFVDGIDAEQVCDLLLLADHYGRQQLQAMALAYAPH